MSTYARVFELDLAPDGAPTSAVLVNRNLLAEVTSDVAVRLDVEAGWDARSAYLTRVQAIRLGLALLTAAAPAGRDPEVDADLLGTAYVMVTRAPSGSLDATVVDPTTVVRKVEA